MKREELQKLVKETVNEVINEELMDLERLHANITPNTMIGQPWNKMISQLETIYDEVSDFQELYRTHSNKPTTDVAKQKLDQVIRLLEEIAPTIQQIHQIQRSEI